MDLMDKNYTPDPLNNEAVSATTPDYNSTVDNAPARPEGQDGYTTPADARVSEKKAVKKSFAGGAWAALIIGALLLILLLVFILQNQQSVTLSFFAWEFAVPAGVGFLLAAVAGGLIMAMVGGVRMMQLRRQIKRGK